MNPVDLKKGDLLLTIYSYNNHWINGANNQLVVYQKLDGGRIIAIGEKVNSNTYIGYREDFIFLCRPRNRLAELCFYGV